MASLAERLQALAQRALNVPSPDKNLHEMEAEFLRIVEDLEREVPQAAAQGLLISAQELGRQLIWLYQQRGGLPQMAPPPPPPPLPWPADFLEACKALQISPKANLAEAESAYRQRVKVDHPDRGGSATAFERDHEAIKTVREYWRHHP